MVAGGTGAARARQRWRGEFGTAEPGPKGRGGWWVRATDKGTGGALARERRCGAEQKIEDGWRHHEGAAEQLQR